MIACGRQAAYGGLAVLDGSLTWFTRRFCIVPHGQFRLTLDIDYVWMCLSMASETQPRLSSVLTSGSKKEEMREKLHFIYEVLTNLDSLVIGYELTIELPDGDRWPCRYLKVGKNSEMEIELGHGELFKSRNGHVRLFKETPGEEL
jgi:hypothetical protein